MFKTSTWGPFCHKNTRPLPILRFCTETARTVFPLGKSQGSLKSLVSLGQPKFEWAIACYHLLISIYRGGHTFTRFSIGIYLTNTKLRKYMTVSVHEERVQFWMMLLGKMYLCVRKLLWKTKKNLLKKLLVSFYFVLILCSGHVNISV